MHTVPTSHAEVTTALRRAAARATYAPSFRNSQPWQFVLSPGELAIRADQPLLSRADPMRRQLMISLGCALFNVRASLAASMFAPLVERVPDPDDPQLVARVRIDPSRLCIVGPLAGYDALIEQQQTNHRRFSAAAPPTHVVGGLAGAVAEEGAIMLPVYSQCLLLLGTRGDTPLSWLRTGEALQRAWLELTRRGFAASQITRNGEVASVRAALDDSVRLDWFPHVLVRVGTAPLGPTAVPRQLSDVLTEVASATEGG
jgi:nitroreductase